jgi:membrane associated rhomboid family serine protease
MDFRSYFHHFPITTGILLVNILIFLLNFVGLSEMYSVSFPGVFTSGTFLAHFSHFSMLHFLMNMAVCYRLCPLLETQLKSNTFLIVFLGIWFGLVGFLWFFQENPVVGFSGIMMGFITMLMFLMRRMHRQFSQSLLFLVVLNILVGFLPQISFVGHFGGVIVGAVVFGVYWLLEQAKIV